MPVNATDVTALALAELTLLLAVAQPAKNELADNVPKPIAGVLASHFSAWRRDAMCMWIPWLVKSGKHMNRV